MSNKIFAYSEYPCLLCSFQVCRFPISVGDSREPSQHKDTILFEVACQDILVDYLWISFLQNKQKNSYKEMSH